jgi:hypothetical protein
VSAQVLAAQPVSRRVYVCVYSACVRVSQFSLKMPENAYLCVCACVCVCARVCVRACAGAPAPAPLPDPDPELSLSLCLYMCLSLRICVCLQACMHVCKCTRVCVCASACACSSVLKCACVWMCTFVTVFTYLCITFLNYGHSQCEVMEPKDIFSCYGDAQDNSTYFGLERNFFPKYSSNGRALIFACKIRQTRVCLQASTDSRVSAAMVFQSAKGYADFLYSIADNEYLYRDSRYNDRCNWWLPLLLIRWGGLFPCPRLVTIPEVIPSVCTTQAKLLSV